MLHTYLWERNGIQFQCPSSGEKLDIFIRINIRYPNIMSHAPILYDITQTAYNIIIIIKLGKLCYCFCRFISKSCLMRHDVRAIVCVYGSLTLNTYFIHKKKIKREKSLSIAMIWPFM